MLPDPRLQPTADDRASDPLGEDSSVVVIGAGPAGLTAAYELLKYGHCPLVLEQSHIVGGLARTEDYKGFLYDMGGHRFFTKSPIVDSMWREVLQKDFLRRQRLSRIFYKGKFFHYPLKPLDALSRLGIWESGMVALSYLYSQIFPNREERTFEDWVSNRFGKRLFNTFFRTYTEKVWGIPCSELSSEWAAQRIKDLSLKSAVWSMFRSPGTRIKTLIEAFDYPRRGPGMMWAAFQSAVDEGGGEVRLNCPVKRIYRDGMRITAVEVDGPQAERIEADAFIASMPLTELIKRLDPPPPPAVLQAAGELSYRDLLVVGLILNNPDPFPDNWIYVHDPTVRVGRIQNYKNWSESMVPDPSKGNVGMEYFCNEGDDFWSTPDAELIATAGRELALLGLINDGDVLDGVVFRVPKSYPVYDSGYRDRLDTIRDFVDSLENLQMIGRNGLHRYNNQDHSMLTGIYAVQNLIRGENHDLWQINADEEYHETCKEAPRSRVPTSREVQTADCADKMPSRAAVRS
ncbi:MAG: FAD-dependent oxidoreductase [Planctomycetaceae bacterium]|nr:FAD-dependent oxidoreductase [Planctomycetaceae bacterium]